MTLTESQAFTVGSDWELVSQGAEAKLWKIPAGPLFDVPCIAKERFSKAYRHPALDEKLTKQRCRAESRILTKCVEKGIPAPRVLRTDAPVLYLEYIDAPTVREYLETDLLVTLTDDTQDSPQHNKLQQLADAFGQMVAALHNMGIVHGDLTTSNAMIRLPEMTLVAIDFGLAKNTTSMEERAVDLYVLERASFIEELSSRGGEGRSDIVAAGTGTNSWTKTRVLWITLNCSSKTYDNAIITYDVLYTLTKKTVMTRMLRRLFLIQNGSW